MAFRGSPGALAASLLLRAVLGAALCLLAGVLVFKAHYYASALIVLAAVLLIGLDMARAARAGDRALADFAAAFRTGAADTPPRRLAGFPALQAALTAAVAEAAEDRSAVRRRTDALEGLLDTVASALLVLAPDGSVDLANRSARALARRPVARLSDIEALGPEAARRLEGLPAGARQVLRIADGRRMLAACSTFSAAGGEPRRLVSLQSLSEELTAVELVAWQDLVRTLAHEMMNSLTPVASLSESLERILAGRPELADAADAAGVIARRSRGLMSFVARYRAVADLPHPEPRPVALDGFADELTRLVGPDLEAKGVTLTTRVEPKGLEVQADPDLLAQACINLLKNAAEACEGAPAPRIELACVRSVPTVVVVSVSDNGPGLPEDAETIFVPFFTTKAGGSGIGLSLARQIALAHGGQLQAAAGPAGGAVFAITLPSAPLPQEGLDVSGRDRA